jgi:hypothetical protein
MIIPMPLRSKHLNGLIALVVILAIALAHSLWLDIGDGKLVEIEHKSAAYIGDISDIERSKVEQIIRDYKSRRILNTSISKRICKQSIIGCIRGATVGIILTGNPVAGMVSLGATGGIMAYVGSRAPYMKWIHNKAS